MTANGNRSYNVTDILTNTCNTSKGILIIIHDDNGFIDEPVVHSCENFSNLKSSIVNFFKRYDLGDVSTFLVQDETNHIRVIHGMTGDLCYITLYLYNIQKSERAELISVITQLGKKR